MVPNTFPSDWILGKPRGSIKVNPTNYQLRITTPEGDKNIYFKFNGNEKQAYKECLDEQMKISDEYDLTRNKIRYLDKDTIEVKLTQDKIMKTDSKYIKEVEQYPLITKVKKTNDGEKYYALCQDKKKTFAFSDLITNYKNIKFKNNDSLDLRSNNISEFGEIKINENILNDNKIYDIDNQYKYFEYLKNNQLNNLPKNIWILGKPAGTIFNKNGNKNIYNICVTDNNKVQHTKTLNIKDFNNSEDLIKKESEKIKITMSYKLGMTRNLIRINDNYIEYQFFQLVI